MSVCSHIRLLISLRSLASQVAEDSIAGADGLLFCRLFSGAVQDIHCLADKPLPGFRALGKRRSDSFSLLSLDS